MKRPHFLALLAGVLSGLAMYAWADPLPPDDGSGLPGNNIPVCLNCYLDGQLIRDKTVYATECVTEWGPGFPRRPYVGRCARYKCDYGYYYSFDGWYPLPTYQCTDQIVNDPDTCPTGTCIYIPWLSDPRAAIHVGSSGSKPSCGTGATIPSGPLTATYASQIVRGAMASDDKK